MKCKFDVTKGRKKTLTTTKKRLKVHFSPSSFLCLCMWKILITQQIVARRAGREETKRKSAENWTFPPVFSMLLLLHLPPRWIIIQKFSQFSQFPYTNICLLLNFVIIIKYTKIIVHEILPMMMMMMLDLLLNLNSLESELRFNNEHRVCLYKIQLLKFTLIISTTLNQAWTRTHLSLLQPFHKIFRKDKLFFWKMKIFSSFE